MSTLPKTSALNATRRDAGNGNQRTPISAHHVGIWSNGSAASLRFVRPSAANADLIVDGAAALDWKVEQVLAALRTRHLIRRNRNHLVSLLSSNRQPRCHTVNPSRESC